MCEKMRRDASKICRQTFVPMRYSGSTGADLVPPPPKPKANGSAPTDAPAPAANGGISAVIPWSHGTGLISTLQISRSFYEIFVISGTHHEEKNNLFCVECCVEWCRRYYSEEQLGINFFCFVHSSIHWNKLKHHVLKSCEFLWENK